MTLVAADMPALVGVTHRDVDIGGVRLHVSEAGEGPPILLLHGWPQHWWCWRRVIPKLVLNHRVLAPDLRGFGWSDAPPGSYAKDTFCADIVALLDAEDLDRVWVIGHDWGGYTGFQLALEHPERVKRLLALDIAPPWLRPSRPTARQLAAPFFASYQLLLGTPLLGQWILMNRPGFVRSLIRAGSGPDARWTDEELDAYASVLREPARASASSACYRTFLTRELPAAALRDHSRELSVPTLLAMGEASPLRRILDLRPAPNLRIETIPEAGHFLPEEAPDAVVELAERWFAAS